MSLVTRNLFVAGLTVLAASGCSFAVTRDGTQSIVGYVLKDDARSLYRQSVPGLGVRLGGDWNGVDLGWSELTVLGVSQPGTATAAPSSGYAFPLGWTVRRGDGSQRWYGWVLVDGPPAARAVEFVESAHLGISMQWMQVSRGLTIGFERATVLALDPSTNGTFVLEYASRRPADARLRHLEGETE